MIEINIAVWICIGFLVYYTIFQIFSDFVKSGMTRNTPNRLIARLRTDYQVNIKTFQKNDNLYGFAWFSCIWLNENLFKNESKLLFTFHHEMYHLKHHHKFWILLMRFVLSLLPILLAFIYWWIFAIIFLISALIIQAISNRFEKDANAHADKMIANEKVKIKGKNSNR